MEWRLSFKVILLLNPFTFFGLSKTAKQNKTNRNHKGKALVDFWALRSPLPSSSVLNRRGLPRLGDSCALASAPSSVTCGRNGVSQVWVSTPGVKGVSCSAERALHFFLAQGSLLNLGYYFPRDGNKGLPEPSGLLLNLCPRWRVFDLQGMPVASHFKRLSYFQVNTHSYCLETSTPPSHQLTEQTQKVSKDPEELNTADQRIWPTFTEHPPQSKARAHSQRDPISWATEQTLANLKELKSYRMYSPATMESN